MSKLDRGTLLCTAGVSLITLIVALIKLTTPPPWMFRILDGGGILAILLIAVGFKKTITT